MIYQIQDNQSFDAEILRQELVVALGANNSWYIATCGNQVEFCWQFGGDHLEDIVVTRVITTHFNKDWATFRKNADLQKQIEDFEKQAIADGLVRTIVDDFLTRGLSEAKKLVPTITEAQLVDPQSSYYSRAYEKFYSNRLARDNLRKQKT